MGIGSEGYVSLEMGRRFVGVELKASYYQQAVRNLANATAHTASLFDDAEECAP
jgi:DNA modification methylase